MILNDIFADKNIKSKDKTLVISQCLLEEQVSISELIEYCELTKKDTEKGTCIEAIEYATKVKPIIVTPACFLFVCNQLNAKAARIQWESAKVIGNVVHLFPANIEIAVEKLLPNATSDGTVVRWCTAYALGEIMKLKTPINETLVPIINEICEKEPKNSIQMVYLKVLKKLQFG